MSGSRTARRDDVLTYVGMLLVVLFFGIPLLWILSLSLRDQAEILATSLNPVPSQPTLDNYSTILQSAQFPRFLFNSLLLSLGAAIGVMVVSIPAAYAFSRLDFRGRKGAAARRARPADDLPARGRLPALPLLRLARAARLDGRRRRRLRGDPDAAGDLDAQGLLRRHPDGTSTTRRGWTAPRG